MTKPFILGLAGFRQVGKTTLANHLVDEFGFIDIHPFNGGKVATRAYFMHIGASEEEAWRMTDGDLKDAPSPYLPNVTAEQAGPKVGVEGDHHKPRFFMEHFGKMMGTTLGPDWTIGKEIELALTYGDHDRLIVSSLVYEDAFIREFGAKIWRLNIEGRTPAPGLKTDEYTQKMIVDLDLNNDGPIEELFVKARENLHLLGIEKEPTPNPSLA